MKLDNGNYAKVKIFSKEDISRIVELFLQLKSYRCIASEVGCTIDQVGLTISKLRDYGADLPLRNRVRGATNIKNSIFEYLEDKK